MSTSSNRRARSETTFASVNAIGIAMTKSITVTVAATRIVRNATVR